MAPAGLSPDYLGDALGQQTTTIHLGGTVDYVLDTSQANPSLIGSAPSAARVRHSSSTAGTAGH
jgi:hypothetical protein